MAKKPKRKIGRKSLYTPENVKKILQAVELGVPYKHAALAAGISDETFRAWQHRYPEFAAQVEESRAKCIVAHLSHIKSVAARDGQWTPSAWILERCFDEFARAEVKVQMLQLNVGKADDPTAGWLEIANAAVSPALPATEAGETLTLEMPLPDPVELAKPVQALPAPHEVAEQTVEHEPERDPHASSKMYLPDKELTPLEYKMRYGFDKSQVPSQSRGLTVASRPSPPPSPGFNEFGERPML